MVQVNVYEAKTHLSRLLRRVRAGEDVIIADAGRPVARLVPIVAEGPRPLGGDEGVWIADDFDAPLPAAMSKDFHGGESLTLRPPKPRQAPKRKRRERR
jgi:prevent-host-death family protein